MSRYIDAEEVEKRIDVVIGSEPRAWDKKALKELKMYIVHAVPTADVVEVVRCKDCKYSSPNKVYGCRFEPFDTSENGERMYSDDFCSYGERKDEGL